MNIDSTIEDLEAQAYFASQTTFSTDKLTLIIDVELHNPERQTIRLSMAMVGFDFVAGFLKFQSQRNFTWVLIPNHSVNSIDIHQGSVEESIVEISASAFIISKLKDASISIKQFHRLKPSQGRLLNTLGNQLFTKGANLQIFPLEGIEWLAVDNLSADNRT
jgi:hypothetical protein